MAARIAKDDWEAYLDAADTYYMEERMLQGMVLGCIRPDADTEVYLHRVTQFVWNINSWSVCDTFKFGGGKKFVEANKERLWEYLKTWMHAEGEYEIRFGVVMAMQHFIDEEHLDELFSLYGRLLRADGGGMGIVGLLREVPRTDFGVSETKYFR